MITTDLVIIIAVVASVGSFILGHQLGKRGI